MPITHITVLGLGKVGQLVATLLKDTGFKVLGCDVMVPGDVAFETKKLDVSDREMVLAALKKTDAVVSCLPYHLNRVAAESAYKAGIHYFDLTEDVPTTAAIRAMAPTAKGVMAPQCGLAPGFIAIAGAELASRFDRLRAIELRVGALPQHPRGALGYAFNWSQEGVVNEYLNDCEVIREGEIKLVPAMQDLETVVIAGTALEAFTTSGGLGTMCETFKGRVQELNYKTMRYKGHMKLMRFFFHELRLRENRALAGQILVNAKPPVNDDVVYVHAAVEGWSQERLYREEFVRAYYPKEIAGKTWRAIAWTTASAIAAVVEMVAKGALPAQGFITQEDIPLSAFLATKNGSRYA